MPDTENQPTNPQNESTAPSQTKPASQPKAPQGYSDDSYQPVKDENGNTIAHSWSFNENGTQNVITCTYDPETEKLKSKVITETDADGNIREDASTYDPETEKLTSRVIKGADGYITKETYTHDPKTGKQTSWIQTGTDADGNIKEHAITHDPETGKMTRWIRKETDADGNIKEAVTTFDPETEKRTSTVTTETDTAGNIKEETETYDPKTQERTSTVTKKTDAAGNIKEEGACTYDPETGRLASWKSKETDADGNITEVERTYDPETRERTSTVTKETDAAGKIISKDEWHKGPPESGGHITFNEDGSIKEAKKLEGGIWTNVQGEIDGAIRAEGEAKVNELGPVKFPHKVTHEERKKIVREHNLKKFAIKEVYDLPLSPSEQQLKKKYLQDPESKRAYEAHKLEIGTEYSDSLYARSQNATMAEREVYKAKQVELGQAMPELRPRYAEEGSSIPTAGGGAAEEGQFFQPGNLFADPQLAAIFGELIECFMNMINGSHVLDVMQANAEPATPQAAPSQENAPAPPAPTPAPMQVAGGAEM